MSVVLTQADNEALMRQARDAFALRRWWMNVMRIAPFVTGSSILPGIAGLYPLWGALLVVGIGMTVVGLWRTSVWSNIANGITRRLPAVAAIEILEEQLREMKK